jgi:hypothetical protein
VRPVAISVSAEKDHGERGERYKNEGTSDSRGSSRPFVRSFYECPKREARGEELI